MFPTLEQRISAELAENKELCPMCGLDWIIPGTTGQSFGVCPNCYNRAKAEALHAYARDLEVKTDYDAARKQKSRADKKAGGVAVNSKQIPPDFDAIR